MSRTLTLALIVGFALLLSWWASCALIQKIDEGFRHLHEVGKEAERNAELELQRRADAALILERLEKRYGHLPLADWPEERRVQYETAKKVLNQGVGD